MHVHQREDEAWYVLEGHLTFYVADEVLEAGAGSFVFGPMGVAHSFNVDVEPSRVLVFASPAGSRASHSTWATPPTTMIRQPI